MSAHDLRQEIELTRELLQSAHQLMLDIEIAKAFSRDPNRYDILEIICRYRLPEPTIRYYEIYMLEESVLGFYSVSIIKDGCSLRVPRTISGPEMVDYYRAKGNVYVLKTAEEARAWMLHWSTVALVPRDIYDSYFSLLADAD